MGILLVGLNHRTAPMDVREQLAFSREGAATALLLFRNQFPNSEASILSTCNRVEMLVASDDDRPNLDDVVGFIAQARDLPVSHFRPHLYEFRDEQAIRHVFRVASGLDSMVLGEYQIVNQVKTTYAQATEQGTTGRLLNRLYHHAFSVSKRVRSETEIGARKTSIPSVAVEVAQGIFDDFTDKRVLVVGAGEMAQLVCQYLRDAEVKHFTVTSRTLLNAKSLADACRGRAVPYAELDAELANADIVITATSCPKAILTVDRVRAAQRQRKQDAMFVIDLAVPRNVAKGVEKLNQVYVYDIDALGRIVERHRQHRAGQMERCEAILDEEIAAFEQWVEENRARPLIRQVFADAAELREMELARLFNGCPDLTDAQRDAVEQLADRLIKKLMHPTVHTLRQRCQGKASCKVADALHEMTVKQRRQCGGD